MKKIYSLILLLVIMSQAYSQEDKVSISCNVIYTKPNAPAYILKECNDARVELKLSEALSDDLIIPLEYKTDLIFGKHLHQTDKTYCPQQLVIPAGELSAFFFVRCIDYDLPHKYEAIKITYPNVSTLDEFSDISLAIKDIDPFFVDIKFHYYGKSGEREVSLKDLDHEYNHPCCRDSVVGYIGETSAVKPYTIHWGVSNSDGNLFNFNDTLRTLIAGQTWDGILTLNSLCHTEYIKEFPLNLFMLRFSVKSDQIDLVDDEINPRKLYVDSHSDKVKLTAEFNAPSVKWSTGEKTEEIIVDMKGVPEMKLFCTAEDYFCKCLCNTDSEKIEIIITNHNYYPTQVNEAYSNKVVVPSYLSIHSSGENSRFIVRIDEDVENYQCRIYSILGNVVYSSDDINESWIPGNNQQSITEGIYIVKIQYKTNSGELKQYSSKLLLAK
ncbi:MAG: T9SS type A sorting domain-containing protein [Bacteroidales bacterium]